MSKKSNPTLIGAFVVGATVLLATGVTLFGGAELFASRERYVAYFTENTQGLREGSNVVLNGVQVGLVSGIALYVDEITFDVKTEVIIEILPQSYIVTRDGITIGDGLDVSMSHEVLINEGGLRAVLQAESLVTGLLLVELTLRPDTEPVLRGNAETVYPEIPTIPSAVQELLAKVRKLIADAGDLDIGAIIQRVESALRGIDELANSQDVREALAGMNKLINEEETQQLSGTLQAALNEFRDAASDASILLQNTDTKLETLQADLGPILERVTGALDEVEATLVATRYQLEGETVETYRLGATLREVEVAARSLREFMDYLDRNPEALLRGKTQ